jgi:uncharacterized membrane protein
MTDRGLKIALGLSVALNVFVIGAVAGVMVTGVRGLDQPPRRERPPVIQMIQSLDQADQAAAEQALRDAGLAAREDFNTARSHRSEAINLAGAETFDRAAVEAALAQSREAEARGRGRLEGSLLDVMERLDQADRQRLAPGLSRRGREGRRDRRAPRGGEAGGGGAGGEG